MLHSLFSMLIVFHVIFGAVSLLAFWIPVFSRKGQNTHRKVGKIFAYAMLITAGLAGIAALMSIIAPIATHPDVAPERANGVRLGAGLMLAYLASITFVSAFAGLRTVQLKRRYGGHRDRTEIAINLVALTLAGAVLAAGITVGSSLMIGLSMIGLLGVPGNLKLLLMHPKTPMEWFYQHMGSMLGAGIAAHTAFLVFGFSRLAPAMANHVMVWLAPTIIGVPTIIVWTRYYRKRHNRRAVPQAKATKPELSSSLG